MELLKVFLPVVTLLGTTVYAQTQKNCTRTLDLVFVVDGSNSVHPINFNQLRTALLNSVDSLTMGPGNTRVGVVTYGTGIRDRIPITDNKQALMSAISGLQWPDGTTLTDEALDWGRSQLDSNVRDGVPRVIVVLTDGQSNDPDRTLASAQAAKAKGIQLYALGVGQLVDKTELNNIVAPHLNRVFLFDDFPALNAQLQAITVEVCQTVCTSGVDMVFVLDGSASVVSFRFRNMLTTVVATAQSFWSSYPQSRLAIITYASGVTDTVPLADVANQAAFSAAAAAIDYPNGGTTTAQGIVAANDMLRANRRGEIPRVIVVITDGRSDDPAATTRAALDAKNEGITVFAIGVGDQVDKAELERIASAAGLSTAFSDFTILSQRLSSQIGALCAATTTTTTTTTTPAPTTSPPIVPECTKAMDVVFLVDGSTAVGFNNFQTLKTAVRHAALYYVISQSNTRVGVISYSTSVTGGFPPTGDRNAVDLGIQKLQYYGGSRETSLALQSANRDLNNVTIGVRPDVPRVVVVVTAGNSDIPARTVAQVQLLRQAGTYIYALGVGNAVGSTELDFLTNGAATQQYRANDFSFVRTQLVNLASVICARDFTTTTTTTTTITTTTTPPTTRPTSSSPPTTTTTSTSTTTTTTGTTTTTTTTTPMPPTPAPPPVTDHCSESRVVHGVGFRYDPYDCTAFIQCYFREDNSSLAVHRKCPLGQFWDQGRLTCDETCNVDCPEDPCFSLLDGLRRPMNGSCRGFWVCLGGKSRPRCCPEDHRYVIGYGCVYDCTCTDPCGPRKCNSAVCSKKPDWADIRRYDMLVPSAGWVSIQCMSGTFDIGACSCH